MEAKRTICSTWNQCGNCRASVEFDVTGPHEQAPSVGHRLDGVDREILQHLTELVAIDLDDRQRRVDRELELDLGARQREADDVA